MSQDHDSPSPTPEPPRPVPQPESIDPSQQQERVVDDVLNQQGLTRPDESQLTYSVGSNPRSDADHIEQLQIAERQRALMEKAATASDMGEVLAVTNEGLRPTPQPSGEHRELLARKAGSHDDYTTAVPRPGSAYEGQGPKPDGGSSQPPPAPKAEPKSAPAPSPTPPGRSRGR